jgi:hypothetical protein
MGSRTITRLTKDWQDEAAALPSRRSERPRHPARRLMTTGPSTGTTGAPRTPINTTFATVRLRQRVTQGTGSWAAGTAMGVQADRVCPHQITSRQRAPPGRPRPCRRHLREGHPPLERADELTHDSGGDQQVALHRDPQGVDYSFEEVLRTSPSIDPGERHGSIDGAEGGGRPQVFRPPAKPWMKRFWAKR